MRIVGVLDLKEGQIVHAIGGRRRAYRPIVSQLASSATPLEVALGFRAHLGLSELYLADLDAIGGADPNFAVYEALLSLGFVLWIDAGIRRANDAGTLARLGVQTVVAGLETLPQRELIRTLARDLGTRLVVSLDLYSGAPLGACGQGRTARQTAEFLLETGVRRFLVLDLAHVGLGGGTGTEELCTGLLADHPEVELSVGGGIAQPADLRRLRNAGVSAVLIASALHDGRIGRSDVDFSA
jgi:phosphoribosylformimino-5-aminoimidazole carboxamide ribotide isomerase